MRVLNGDGQVSCGCWWCSSSSVEGGVGGLWVCAALAPARAVREGLWSFLSPLLVVALFMDFVASLLLFVGSPSSFFFFSLAALPDPDSPWRPVAYSCFPRWSCSLALPTTRWRSLCDSRLSRSAHSTELNGSRLKVLKARDEVLREVYDDADKRLARISTENPDVYKALLSSLILQSLLALRDEEVVVRTREADAPAVESALKTVSEEYTDKNDGAPINAVVDSKRFLSENW